MNGQQDNNTQHNAEKIIRYLSGKMGREENHAFERAMVDDDLLADAVEGYQLMRESMTDEEILAKANAVASRPVQKEENKASVVSFARFRWVAYAVAAFLVVGAGWFIFNLTQRGTNLPEENASPAMEEKALVQADEKANEINSDDQGKVAELTPSDSSSSKTTYKKSEIAKSAPTKSGSDELAKTPQSSNRAMADQTLASKTEPSESSLLMADSATGKIAASKKNMVANVKMDPAALINVIVIDTTEAIPETGWDNYKTFLGQILPKIADNNVSRAIISIEANGKVSQVRLEGKLSPSEKKTTENAILKGPDWKTKSSRPAKAIFEWQ